MLRISGILTLTFLAIAVIGCIYLAVVMGMGASVSADEVTHVVHDPYHILTCVNIIVVNLFCTCIACPLWLYARIKQVAERHARDIES